jgi:UDP-2,3-diacylglucosamine pyrophosphatase LpxH
LALQTDYTLKGKQHLTIIPVGDIHRGSPELNRDYLEYWQSIVEKIPDPKRIYLMGDLLESATKHLANSSFQQEMSLTDQINETIDFFKPMKEDIVFACKGNHELRLEKDYDLNLMELIAGQLGCPHGNQYMDCFNVNDKAVNVYVAHGKGSSLYHYTAESKILRDTQTIISDLYIHGHNHRCGHFSIPTKTHEGLKRRHYIFSGSFLGYGGYASAMQLPVLPEAFIILGLNKECRVFPNIHYIDERKPELMGV